MEIKISVIVPVYNTEKYLQRCLKSIIEQNLEEIEIIIINDKSTDNSLKIIIEYMKLDSRIILINKEKNEGLSNARNNGIEIARGKYIVHIDSDDWIEQNYFKDLYETAMINHADIIISDYFKDFDDGRIFYKIDQNKNKKIEKIQAIENIFIKNYPCIWSKLIKRELYIKNNIIHPSGISLGEDLAVVPKLFYYSDKIIKLNKAYLHYIQHNNSITKKKNLKKIFDIYSVLKELEKFFEDKNIFLGNEFKFFQLNNLYFSEYDLENYEYTEILDYYLETIKKIKLNKIVSIKLKIVILFLKIFNKRLAFVILWKINNLKISLEL